MQLLRKKGMLDSNRVLFLPVDAIAPNPDQPRRVFPQHELEELAASIRSLGLLQPLTVRRGERGWELVAGERRLRAAKLAGLTEVPCLSLQIDSSAACGRPSWRGSPRSPASPSRSTASAPPCWPWWRTSSAGIWTSGRRPWP